MQTSKQRKSKKAKETAIIAVGIVLIFAIVFGIVSAFKKPKNGGDSTTGDAVKTTESTAPETTLPPEPKGDISDTVKGGHYNNNVAAYFSGAVLVCGDYALELVGSNPSEDYAAVVSAFAEKYPNLNVSCAIVPKSSAFYIPSNVSGDVSESIRQNIANQYRIQQKFITGTYGMMSDKVKTVDVMGELTKHNGEYTYYRTDHHWNSLGAYYASVAYCNANKIEPRSIYDYETQRLGEYVGSMQTFCKTHQDCLDTNPDVTIVRFPKAQASVTIVADGVETEGRLLDTSAPQYWTAFLGGDHPLTVIKTDNNTGRKLIIFKESFGNAFATYMADYYDEIYVVDIRESVEATSSLISEHGITDVLFINNIFSAVSLVSDVEEKAQS